MQVQKKLCNEDFPENLNKSLEHIIRNEGYTTYEVEKKLIAADGGSFLSKQYAITVKGNTIDGEKETHIFLKSIIPCEKVGQTLNLPQAYTAEAFVYNELSKIYSELQDEAAIPAADRIKIIKSYDVSNSEGIFLENVVVKGYKPCHRAYTMTLEVAEMALREIAKFHALSFVVEAKRPEYFKNKVETIKHPFDFNEEWDQSGENVASIAAQHLTEETRTRIEEFIPKIAAKWKTYQDDTTLAKCCLCHGDFRLNNLLMKHMGDKVEDLYVVDYQLIYYAPPLNDFLFFIFLGTDRQFRTQHLDYLKEFYYHTFSKFLGKFHLDSEDIYPRYKFEEEYQDRLEYGLVSALAFLPFFLSADGDIPDLGDESVGQLQFTVHDSFPARMQGIVDDYIQWGYL